MDFTDEELMYVEAVISLAINNGLYKEYSDRDSIEESLKSVLMKIGQQEDYEDELFNY
jgi:hypothetical protein